jgi:hypothetical protein
MVLLGDVGQVEALSVCLEIVLIFALGGCTVLRRMYHGPRNHFWQTQWYSLVMWVKWKLVSVHLETMLISALDGCTVCAECTMGMEIILGTPDGTPR